jgi:hypothetical protein
VAQGSGLTRGDRNRNQRIAALRAVVRRDRAVLAIDLGEDKQVAAVVDHEGRVLARKTVRAKAYQLVRCWRGRRARPRRRGLPGWWWRVSRPGTGGRP